MARTTVAELLQAGEGLIGRERELDLLRTLAARGGPVVAYLYGPPGSGTSTLLRATGAALTEAGFHVLRLDGGRIEPRPEALIAALAEAMGASFDELGTAVKALRALGRVAVLIDHMDRLRLAATWLRRTFVPALPVDARLVLAGAAPPPVAWTMDFGPLFLPLLIGPLTRDDVLDGARAAGLSDEAAQRVWNLSGGHPLAMRLALHLARTGALGRAGSAASLADAVVAAADAPGLSVLVEAAAVLRRVSRPLLAAILGEEALAAYDAFLGLPFVQSDSEGLYIAEPVRSEMALRLAAEEPVRHAALRREALAWLRRRIDAAGPRERWRSMADMLFLVDHPQIRDAFFPPVALSPPVEPARADDIAAILDLALARAGPAEAMTLRAWATHLPHRFAVARGDAGEVRGFHLTAPADDPLKALASQDTVLATWMTHLANDPAGQGTTLMIRRTLAADPDDSSPDRAACYLDLKRLYLQQSYLARVYAAADGAEFEGPLLRRLGFRPLAPPGDGLPGSLVLDLPGGLAGWIAGLLDEAAAPLTTEPLTLDRKSRELTIEGRTLRLTGLEAAVLAALIDNVPAVVSREDLIETVWQRAFVGSNVVDAVIRTLRRKLGPRRDLIETVPKVGYRLRKGSAAPVGPSPSGV